MGNCSSGKTNSCGRLHRPDISRRFTGDDTANRKRAMRWGNALLLAAGIVEIWLFGQSATAQNKKPTAREVVAAIREHIGGEWKNPTVDSFKAGNPDTPVTGIAVTMMATIDVLQRAAANGENLVITHEPTFYSHLDTPEGLEASDPVWKEKREFIEKHGLVIWRLHDHWHARKPDGILAGMTRVLGWEKYQNPENQSLYILPETTLRKLAEDVSKKLDSPVLRVVGDPEMRVTGVVIKPGYTEFSRNVVRELEMNNVDVMLVGETREWETVEYVADAVSEGKRKALVILGHVPSEQAGMEDCARWLKTFVKDIPIEFVPTKQPFWTLAQ